MVKRFPVLRPVFRSRALWKALDGYYGAFMYTVLAGVGWFAATLSLRDRTRFATGFTLLWVAGAWFYLAVPALLAWLCAQMGERFG